MKIPIARGYTCTCVTEGAYPGFVYIWHFPFHFLLGCGEMTISGKDCVCSGKQFGDGKWVSPTFIQSRNLVQQPPLCPLVASWPPPPWRGGNISYLYASFSWFCILAELLLSRAQPGSCRAHISVSEDDLDSQLWALLVPDQPSDWAAVAEPDLRAEPSWKVMNASYFIQLRLFSTKEAYWGFCLFSISFITCVIYMKAVIWL